MSRFLIAGGAGFIGYHLTKALLSAGHEVHVIDNLSTGTSNNLLEFEAEKGFAFSKIDITQSVPKDNFHYIVHLACAANPTDYQVFPLQTLQVNACGNLNLMALADECDAKYYFASSSEVYGKHVSLPSTGLREDSASIVNLGNERSPYAIGKMFAEEFIRAHFKNNTEKYLILRPFNVYGSRMDPQTTYGRVIPNFIGWAKSRKPLLINGDGLQQRSFCHIDDFVDCMTLLFAVKEAPPFDVVNIGNPHPIRIIDLATKVNVLLDNDSQHQFKRRHEHEPLLRTPNIERLRNWIGWEPQIGLDEGIRSIAAASDPGGRW